MYILIFNLHASRSSVVVSFSTAIAAIPTSMSPVWSKSNKHSTLSPQTSVKFELFIKSTNSSSRNGGVWSGLENEPTDVPASYVKILSSLVICPRK